MALDISGLSPQQREAITHQQGPLQVMAGPGSGKTFVIEQRAAALIDQGAMPESIGIVTFTRKAAGELRGRIEERIGAEIAQRMRIQTTWSLALEICTEEKRINDLAVPQVLDPLDVFEYFRRAVSELGLEAEHNLKRTWETIAQWKLSGRDSTLLAPVTSAVLNRYQMILEAENKWDLSDLIVNAIGVLETNHALHHALDLEHLLVDEWQDSAP